MLRVSKTQIAGKPGYSAQWRDSAGKKFCRGLNTTSELEADQIVADLQRVLNSPTLHNPDAPGHVATMPKTYRAFFTFEKRQRHELTETLPAAMFNPSLIAEPGGDEQMLDVVIQSKEFDDALNAAAEADKRALAAEAKLEAVIAENIRLSRALNKHCKKTIAAGVAEFKRGKTDVSKKSLDTYVAALEDFQLFLGAGDKYPVLSTKVESAAAQTAIAKGGEFLVADIRGHHLDDFLSSRRDKKTGQPITEKRKVALRRELSVPYHFWQRRFELTFDAFEHAQPLTGHKATAPDSREMIRTVTDLNRLIEALGHEGENALYWQTFVGMACLTGADLSNLFDLTPQDIIFEEPARIIVCRNKTGKQRNTPIERTILHPLLQRYIESVPKGQTFVFPSLREQRTKMRRFTAVGRWSGASAFGESWKEVADRCRARIQKRHKLSAQDTYYCSLGPRAWRRSASTFMAGAGVHVAQAAQWLGHDVSIAFRHYMGKVQRNGLEFEAK